MSLSNCNEDQVRDSSLKSLKFELTTRIRTITNWEPYIRRDKDSDRTKDLISVT